MTTLTELSANYERQRSEFIARVGKAQAIQEQVTALTAKVTRKQNTALVNEKVAELFQVYSESEHDQLRERIEGLVTLGIETVFGPGIAFKLTPSTKGGQAVIAMTVVSEIAGEDVETEIAEARGGGLAAVIGFVLRVVILSLSPEKRRPTLFLDETFSALSEDYGEGLSRLLRRLTDEIDLQVILVTHNHAQAECAGKVYELRHDGTKTSLVK